MKRVVPKNEKRANILDVDFLTMLKKGKFILFKFQTTINSFFEILEDLSDSIRDFKNFFSESFSIAFTEYKTDQVFGFKNEIFKKNFIDECLEILNINLKLQQDIQQMQIGVANKQEQDQIIKKVNELKSLNNCFKMMTSATIQKMNNIALNIKSSKEEFAAIITLQLYKNNIIRHINYIISS